jgi:hypothetical protein
VSVEHIVGALNYVKPHLGISCTRKGMLLRAFSKEVIEKA